MYIYIYYQPPCECRKTLGFPLKPAVKPSLWMAFMRNASKQQVLYIGRPWKTARGSIFPVFVAEFTPVLWTACTKIPLKPG